MIKVSIIIPVYNGEEKIKNNLSSLCSQTFKDWEAIVVDDGSKDNTKQTIKKFQAINKKIKYFYKENSGVSDTRNYGISKAKGNYICFIDCDDFYDENYLKELYNKIINEKADVCYCGYKTFNNFSIKKVKTNFAKENVLYKYFIGNLRLQTGCFMIKKEIIKKFDIKFRSGINWGEDYEFFSKILKYSNKICYVKKYLLNYDNQENIFKLSNISCDKIEKDKSMVNNICNELNLTKKEYDALVYYRKPALILNKLYLLKDKLPFEEFKKVYLGNQSCFKELKVISLFRFLKLTYIKFRLKDYIK